MGGFSDRHRISPDHGETVERAERRGESIPKIQKEGIDLISAKLSRLLTVFILLPDEMTEEFYQ